MRAIFHYACSQSLSARLAALAPPWLDIRACPESDDAQLYRLLENADVLLHVLKPVTAGVIDAAPGLQLIQKIGVGVNTIDLEHARRRAIRVCNMPGTNSRAVAEATLMLMLTTLRHARGLDAATRCPGFLGMSRRRTRYFRSSPAFGIVPSRLRLRRWSTL